MGTPRQQRRLSQDLVQTDQDPAGVKRAPGVRRRAEDPLAIQRRNVAPSTGENGTLQGAVEPSMSFMQQAGITREPPFFETLRQNDWKPRFHYEPSLHRTADAINRPHEDYSHRIPATKDAVTGTVEALRRDPRITGILLRQIHRTVFPDHGARRKMAQDQRTGRLPPGPRWEWMDSLMEELEFLYMDRELSRQNLKMWYFETIYPFVDGNGRTGGIVIAVTFLQHGIYLALGQ